MKRPLFTVLVGLLAIACAACGGGAGATGAAAGKTLPEPLVKQIKAEIMKPSPIGDAASAKAVEVYGPTSRRALEDASSMSGPARAPGAWYLIVLHGNFVGNVPAPPGAKQTHARIAMEVWSPSAKAGQAYSFANRVPKAVSGLKGPTMIDLS